jgi:hypothetical protein
VRRLALALGLVLCGCTGGSAAPKPAVKVAPLAPDPAVKGTWRLFLGPGLRGGPDGRWCWLRVWIAGTDVKVEATRDDIDLRCSETKWTSNRRLRVVIERPAQSGTVAAAWRGPTSATERAALEGSMPRQYDEPTSDAELPQERWEVDLALDGRLDPSGAQAEPKLLGRATITTWATHTPTSVTSLATATPADPTQDEPPPAPAGLEARRHQTYDDSH